MQPAPEAYSHAETCDTWRPSRRSTQVALVANRVETRVMADTGQWLVEERPREALDALTSFL